MYGVVWHPKGLSLWSYSVYVFIEGTVLSQGCAAMADPQVIPHSVSFSHCFDRDEGGLFGEQVGTEHTCDQSISKLRSLWTLLVNLLASYSE